MGPYAEPLLRPSWRRPSRFAAELIRMFWFNVLLFVLIPFDSLKMSSLNDSSLISELDCSVMSEKVTEKKRNNFDNDEDHFASCCCGQASYVGN